MHECGVQARAFYLGRMERGSHSVKLAYIYTQHFRLDPRREEDCHPPTTQSTSASHICTHAHDTLCRRCRWGHRCILRAEKGRSTHIAANLRPRAVISGSEVAYHLGRVYIKVCALESTAVVHRRASCHGEQWAIFSVSGDKM